MTDRDAFAAAALTGLLANHPVYGSDHAPRRSYELADAMLRERGQQADPQSEGWLNYNANDYVRVKLTDHGRELLKRQHEQLNAVTTYLPYTPPTEDADGWSRWQLHRLMNHFGEHTGMGLPLCFETTIQFDSARANQDATPVAKASEATASPERVSARSDAGTGDTQEPIAWAAMNKCGKPMWLAYSRDGVTDMVLGGEAVPLYRHPQPTLTEEEREAITIACGDSLQWARPHVAALLRLLERTK